MEILTGIAGEAFKEWLYEKYGDKEVPTDFEKNYLIVTFNRLSPEQQQGDLLAFFRDKGIDIEITKWEDQQREMDNIRTNKYYWIIYVDNEFKSLDCECKTYEMQPDYSTAFNEAINKAVEIYNGKEL